MTTNDDPENLPARRALDRFEAGYKRGWNERAETDRLRGGTFSEAFIRRGELTAAYEAAFWEGYRAAVWREARGGPDEWPAQVMARRRDDYMNRSFYDDYMTEV